jgi:hypothetical protein
MGIIIWLIVGGIWLASSLIMRRTLSRNLPNIVVGVVGAVIAGLLFGGGSSLNNGLDRDIPLFADWGDHPSGDLNQIRGNVRWARTCSSAKAAAIPVRPFFCH